MDNISAFVDLATKLLDSGIITPRQFGEALNKYTTKDIVDFNLDEEALKNLDDTLREEMENINMEGDTDGENGVAQLL